MRQLTPCSREEEDAKNEGTNLFVTGISKSVTETELEDLFTRYGVVEKCQIMTDPHTAESRGFGFVNMADVTGAEAAINALNDTDVAGRTLSIEKAKRKRPRTPTPGRYFGPPKARRGGPGGGRPRFDDRYRDSRRDYGRRYDDRPRFDDPYRRPRFEERGGDMRDRYYRGRERSDRGDRGDRYAPRYDERDRYPPRDYGERYERRYSREERPPLRDDRPPLRDDRPPLRDDRPPLRDDRPPLREPREERYRDDVRERYPPPISPADGYREREEYRA